MHHCSSGILSCGFLFFFLSDFGIRVRLTSQNKFGNVPSSTSFGEKFRRISADASVSVWQN